MLKKGLTGQQLKLIGLVLMVCDHVHQMFYYAGDLTWLSMLGRPVLPLFLYLCAEGYAHTRSKRAYALRLLLWSMGMRAVTLFVQQAFPITAHSVELMNNVFATMFVSVLLMMAVDAFRAKAVLKGLGLLALPLLPLLIMFPLLQADQVDLARVFVLFPSYLAVEGGPVAVILALLFYLFRGKRLYQYLALVLVAILNLALALPSGFSALFTTKIQWLMIGALPLLMLYNGQRGQGNKHFFYVFYPVHIWLLYLLAYYLLASGVIK